MQSYQHLNMSSVQTFEIKTCDGQYTMSLSKCMVTICMFLYGNKEDNATHICVKLSELNAEISKTHVDICIIHV